MLINEFLKCSDPAVIAISYSIRGIHHDEYLLFPNVTLWHGIKGGMEIHGKLMSEGLVKKGHKVSVISTRHSEDKGGVKIYYLKNTVFGSRMINWGRESVKKILDLHRKTSLPSFGAKGLPLMG